MRIYSRGFPAQQENISEKSVGSLEKRGQREPERLRAICDFAAEKSACCALSMEKARDSFPRPEW